MQGEVYSSRVQQMKWYSISNLSYKDKGYKLMSIKIVFKLTTIKI
ncbi:hypothetical protein GXM_05507 [Nostoc sphaeroides CCNUC1]|uniref:Uncharacterized protein n=1 Tax=Nostoc sphaeroides CCNUC1 TaxID=2653204 RepID=A0A5P8W5J6_9NOSO|nr:hypothetical protein GXM_05507 [Nostoc sphaeroides CCNUC1]